MPFHHLCVRKWSDTTRKFSRVKRMEFWRRFPALFYGLALIAGFGAFYNIYVPLLIGLSGKTAVRILGFYLVACAFYCYSGLLGKERPQIPCTGSGYFQIKSMRHTEGSWQYRGVLRSFITEDKTYYDLPCTISFKKRLKGDCDYIINGVFKPTGLMKVKQWKAVFRTFNLSELRCTLKDILRKYLKKHIANPHAYAFYASLGTGEIETKYLGCQFNRVGLRHTLALSGFHYMWLIFILGFFLHLVFSKRTTCMILLGLTTLYFTFIGETPSLNRAYLAALIYLIGYLIYKNSYGLNALGVALLFSLIANPFVLLEIGFQLSYLATFALLAFFPSIETLLSHLLPKRTLEEVKQMNYLNQHGYILASLIRQSLALSVAVTMVTLPLILYHFHYFPWVSLLFNLFFPQVMTVSMVLLILGLLFPFLLTAGGWYITFWLNLIFYGTGTFDRLVLYGTLPLPLLSYFLTAFVALGVYLEERRYQLTIIEHQI